MTLKDTSTLDEVAEYLIDQRGEPFPDGSHEVDSRRLHYWRDKCIYASRRLKSLKAEQPK